MSSNNLGSRFGEKVLCNPTVKLEKAKLYPLIDIERINPAYKSVCSNEYVEYTGQSGSKFNDHDVLMARITPCLENGKLAIAKSNGERGIGSTELFVFRGIDGVSDTDYIYYLLSMPHMRQLATNSMTGASGRQRADLGFIKRIQWNFPDIAKQKRIADILSVYDSLIELNNKRIKLLEQMAENLYKEWFVRFRFPGHETAEFENGIPKGWKAFKISELCDINARTLKTSDNIGIIRYLDTGSLTQNHIDGFEDYDQGAEPSRAKRRIKENSILYSTVRPNLRHFGLLKSVEENWIVSTGFAVLDCKQEIQEIIYLALSMNEVVDYFSNIAEASVATYPSIKPEEIGKLVVCLPDLKQLEMLNMPFRDIFNNAYKIQEINQNLIKQRDLLLPRLMSGKLEV